MKFVQTKTAAVENTTRTPPFFSKRSGRDSFDATSSEQPFFTAKNDLPKPIQAKLNVGKPDDHFEREADQKADQVIRDFNNPVPEIQSKQAPLAHAITPLLQNKCIECEQEEKLQKKDQPLHGKILRKAIFESNEESGIQQKQMAGPAKSFSDSITGTLQAKCNACEQEDKNEENEISRKALPGSHALAEGHVQKKCTECEEEEKKMQKKDDDGNAPVHLKSMRGNQEPEDGSPEMKLNQELPGIDGVESRLKQSKENGTPLAPEINRKMSQAFGSDFSGVKIHNDSAAIQMNKELHAQAFTHGSDIYFNEGKFDTNSDRGKRLLAHELTHTVQQGAVKEGNTVKESGINHSGNHNQLSKSPDNLVMRSPSFASTMEICRRVLTSRKFQVSEGSVMIMIDPKISNPEGPDCTNHKFYVNLVQEVDYGSDVEYPSVQFDSSGLQKKGWSGIPNGTYYFTIWRTYDNPNCCLKGDILVTEGDASAVMIESCDDIRKRKGFPSQNGGNWDWHGTGKNGKFGPGEKLPAGPLPVYERDPKITSTSLCRGACGPNCDTCKNLPEYIFTDPETGLTWKYINYEVCDSHDGCREHDAAFDWAAAVHGEVGRWANLMKWHMAANRECSCNYNLFQCAGWIRGKPPHDSKLLFADSVEQVKNLDGVKITPMGPASVEVPLIQQTTYDTARDAILNKDFAAALEAVMMDLMGSGKVDPALFRYKFEDRTDSGEGLTETTYTKDPTSGKMLPNDRSTVTIYTLAFSNVQWLVTTIMHEYNHVKQGQQPRDPNEFIPRGKGGTMEETTEAHEVESYLWEMEHTVDTGLSAHPGSVKETLERLTDHYNALGKLNPARQATYTPRYEAVKKMVPPPTPEEEKLEKCDRGALPLEECNKLYKKVRERFGNKERNVDFDPDKDVNKNKRRIDDAPLIESFRLIYNRMDSWDIYMRRMHENLYPEFTTTFNLNQKRNAWISYLKERTAAYKSQFRDVQRHDVEQSKKEFEKLVKDKIESEINTLNHDIATWYKAKTGSAETIEAIIERIHIAGTKLWREEWLAAILAINRIFSSLWPPAKTRIIKWVEDQRKLHPGEDLKGQVKDIDYVGSTATGYKGAPKQFIRFNVNKFDVDANIEAPPLAKFAMKIDGIKPDRQRIFTLAQGTSITPLINFCYDAHRAMSEVSGYDPREQFDVVIWSPETAEQKRGRLGTKRIYDLREKLSETRYNEMIRELTAAGLLEEEDDGGWRLKEELSVEDEKKFNGIISKYENQ